MGGGALSSNVSKLGSKEVSKKLRNFSLAPKKACHCEDERSEDVAIAKSLNINEITTQSMIARNDKSSSETNLTTYRLNDSTSFLDTTCDGKRKIAFTLAEVLITLGIIGVVSALTLPSIIHNVQKVILKDQFKRAYSNFYNAIKYNQVQNGAPYACFYWNENPYGDTVCQSFNQYGGCTKYTLAGGKPMPGDYNGKATDCRKFTEDLMKTLKAVKFCERNALANGCITDKYRGIDKVKGELNPDKTYDPNTIFGDISIKEKNPTFITADGVLYSKYLSMTAYPSFMIDVNGHKGPNKWGYDIFLLRFKGDEVNGITKIEPINWLVEKGGMSVNEMLSGK